eukprot:CAMPEP_0117510482 /NCGR_PEP_ID=MMETSP0784-20121206/28013_1 /TAXON_ID=39447 /ORGANISM="" /LENGTH=65 /DNA_ID=CAMNT_0005306121 /DNA_START=789 /DNA_END=983 /DNA_ORIENTATION=-
MAGHPTIWRWPVPRSSLSTVVGRCLRLGARRRVVHESVYAEAGVSDHKRAVLAFPADEVRAAMRS